MQDLPEDRRAANLDRLCVGSTPDERLQITAQYDSIAGGCGRDLTVLLQRYGDGSANREQEIRQSYDGAISGVLGSVSAPGLLTYSSSMAMRRADEELRAKYGLRGQPDSVPNTVEACTIPTASGQRTLAKRLGFLLPLFRRKSNGLVRNQQE